MNANSTALRHDIVVFGGPSPGYCALIVSEPRLLEDVVRSSSSVARTVNE